MAPNKKINRPSSSRVNSIKYIKGAIQKEIEQKQAISESLADDMRTAHYSTSPSNQPVIPNDKVARGLVSIMPQKLKPEDLIAWQTEQGSLHGATEGACYREIPESVALEKLIDAVKKENSVDDNMMDPVAIKTNDGEYTTGAQISTAVNQQLASLRRPVKDAPAAGAVRRRVRRRGL